MRRKIIEKLNNNFVVWFIAMICCTLWGSAFPFIKLGYKYFEIESNDTFSIILFAGIRFFIAGLLTIFFASIIDKKFLVVKRDSVKKVITISLFQTIFQYVFFYLGLASAFASISSIVNSSSTFFAIIISALIFKYEKLTINKNFGMLLGFAGIVILNYNSTTTFGFESLKGEGFIILSALSSAVSSVLIKKYSQYDNPVAISGYQFVFGGMVMVVISLIFGGSIITINTRGLLVLLYLSLLSAVAYTLWSILLKYNDVSKITICSFMIPIFGVLLSFIILGEKGCINIYTGISLILVAIGIYAVNIKIKHTENSLE